MTFTKTSYITRDDILVILLVLATLVVYISRFRKARLALPLPPSPVGLPLLGHLFSLPTSEEHVAYRNIGEQLKSDVISFTVLGQVIVVLNSIESAKDLLVKRSAIYSDRAEFPMLNDDRCVGWGKDTGFLPYGERWRHQRTMTQAVLHPKACVDIWRSMTKNTRSMMQRLLHDPEGFVKDLRWTTTTTMLSCVYGYQTTYPHDNLVELIEIANHEMCEAALPANFFVNIIPWLKYTPSWLPGAGWKRKANEWRNRKDRMINEPFMWAESQIAANIASPSILKTLLTKLTTGEIPNHGLKEEEDIILWTIGTLIPAGSDTVSGKFRHNGGSDIQVYKTVSVMSTFLLAMILYPEIQKKVQAELDTTIGERLPELGDRESLPYLNAVVCEVMRWRAIGPSGIPHACTKDDTYRGFRIPKGAIVIPNIWAMCNSSTVYKNPQDFDPDRFFHSKLPPAPLFGFGRRECPGSQFALSNIFIMASTLLTVFNVDATPGKPFPEAKNNTSTLISFPLPFNSTLTPRSESRRRLMAEWLDD